MFNSLNTDPASRPSLLSRGWGVGTESSSSLITWLVLLDLLGWGPQSHPINRTKHIKSIYSDHSEIYQELSDKRMFRISPNIWKLDNKTPR